MAKKVNFKKLKGAKLDANAGGALLTATQEYTKVLLLFLDEEQPIRDIFKAHKGVMADIAIAMAGAGGAWAGASVWVSSLGFFSSIAYSIGLISMPLWIPIAGGVGGITAASLGIRFLFSSLSSQEKKHVIQLSYHAAYLMALADQKLSQIERDLLENLLLGTGLSKKELDKIVQNVPQTVHDLVVPGSVPEVARRSILLSCWQLALADGITPEEEKTFQQLRLQLQVNASGESLQHEADKLTQQRIQASEALVSAVQAISPCKGEHTQYMIESLLSFNPQAEARERLRSFANTSISIASAAATIAAMTTNSQELLRIVVKAYVTARAYLGSDEQENISALQKNALTLAGELGLSSKETTNAVTIAENALLAEIKNAEKVFSQRQSS